MDIQFTNNASGTLAVAITAVDLGITLQSGEGAEFPILSGAKYFYATVVGAAGNYEIVKVTARTGDAFTIARAQEGTAAQSFAAGSLVELRVTAGSVVAAIEEEVAESNATLATAAGAAGVGITDAGGYYSASTVEDALQEVYAEKQGLDATLTALSNLDVSAGVVYQTGADTFFKRSIGTTVNTIAAGDHTHGSTYQGLDATLTALAALDVSAGVVYQTGEDAFTKKVIGTGAGEVAAGDHTHAAYQGLDGTLTALAALDTSEGVVYQTGADAFTKKTLTAPGDPPLFACRAWCVFNGDTAGTNAPTAGGNVTSVVNYATSVYRVNFTTAMPDANFAVSVSNNADSDVGGSGRAYSIVRARNVAYVDVQFIQEGGGAHYPSYASVAVFR